MFTSTKSLRRLYGALLVGLTLFAFLAYYLVALKGRTDIGFHNESWRRMMEAGTYSMYSAYFFFVGLFSGFSSDSRTVNLGASFVLAAATIAKFGISKRIAFSQLFPAGETPSSDVSRHMIIAVVALVMLLFCDQFPTLGPLAPRFPPNHWRNSTSIFLMPFAVLAFWYAYRFLDTGSARYWPPLLVLICLNVVIKPSFFLVFIVAFPLFALYRFGPSRALVNAAIVAIAGTLVLGAQYYYLFVVGCEQVTILNDIMEVDSTAGPSGVTIGFMSYWQVWMEKRGANLQLSFVATFLFPAAFVAAYFHRIKGKTLFQFLGLCYVVGILIDALLIETGPRAHDGNFTWQMVVLNYLFILFGLIEVLGRRFEEGRFLKRDYAMGAIFFAHFLSGPYNLGESFVRAFIQRLG